MLALKDEVRHEDLALLVVSFHCATMGEEIADIPAIWSERGAHFHIADFPQRHEPGSSKLDFYRIFSAIETSSFNGWICYAYKPANRTEDGTGLRERHLAAASGW